MRYGLVFSLFSFGCLGYDAFVDDPDPEAGGTVQAQMDTQPARATPAMAYAKEEPFTLEGASMELTIGLTAGDGPSGETARTRLSAAGAQIELTFDEHTRSRVEIHLNGTGCVGTAGSIRLTLGEGDKLAGDFQGTGLSFGGTTPCTLSGTLQNVPVYR